LVNFYPVPFLVYRWNSLFLFLLLKLRTERGTKHVVIVMSTNYTEYSAGVFKQSKGGQEPSYHIVSASHVAGGTVQ